MTEPAIHHVAFACRDIDATVRFYDELMGMPLLHTEVSSEPRSGGFLRHFFFDAGDGSCLAFFDVHGVGEQPDWKSEISTGNGLPVWVNHVAFRATEARQLEVKERMAAAGIEPLMDLDHDWCHSLYFVDPNGIMVELCRDTPGLPIDHDEAFSQLHAVPEPPPVPASQ